MKKRTFYIVNLDRNRILLLVVIFTGFLLTAYATGYRLANSGRGDADRKGEQGSSAAVPDHEDSMYSQRDPDDVKSLHSTQPARTERTLDDRIDLSRSMTLSPDRSMDRPRDRSGEKTVERGTARKEKRRSEDNKAAKRNSRKNEMDLAAADKRHESKEKPEKPTTKRDKSLSKTEVKNEAKDQKSARSSVDKPDVKPTRTEKTPLHKDEAASNKAKNPRSALLESSSATQVKMGDPGAEEPKAAEPRTAKQDPKKSTPANDQRKEAAQTKAARFSLQVGAFQTKGAAQRMVESLKTQGFDARVTNAHGHFTVRVGKPNRPADLEKTEVSLKKKSYAPVRVAEE